ncbi:MAG: bifunctional diguanylate cyclase/phosphodiesterase [Ruminococcus sp.]|nr:bifunctional diguanylate cyclase/phosphodiesterase [Ruminococcus sp.]
MKKDKKTAGKTNIDRVLSSISLRKKAPLSVYFVLLALYVAAAVIVIATAGDQSAVTIFGAKMSVYAFAGIFSALSNICIFLIAVYYGKLGFITAFVLIFGQLPSMLIGIFARHNASSLPGLFTNLFTIIATIAIYINNLRVARFEEKMRDQAVTDRLTELPNRFACSEFVGKLVKGSEKFAIVSIDVNNFKSVNDTMGREAGNKVLIEIANRWKKAADEGTSGTVDFISRQSGDEFMLIVQDYDSEQEVIKTIKHYQLLVERKVTVDDCDLYLTASFGYALFPDDAKTSDGLFSSADAAVYELKRNSSSDRILRYNPALLKNERSVEIEKKIRTALVSDSLYFNLQPQYDIDHKLRGFEALARMKDNDGSLISPGEFIPVAEKAGLIDKVDVSVFRNAARFFGNLIKKTGADITLSVNVSVRHLMKNDFIDEIKSIIDTCGVPADKLEIEITESIMIDSAEKALQCITELKRMGLKIAIDDFGTGYSSLSYLINFPADMLKVDKSFIDKMNSSDSSKQYVAAIISIGHIMNFDVISEGVEQSEQLETLRSIGCDFIQGFIWGRPLSPEAAEDLVVQTMQQV